MRSLKEIIKSNGSIGATDMYHNGEMRAEVGRKFINTMIDRNEFLQKITIDKTHKLNKVFDVWDIDSGNLVRVPQGQKPQEEQRRKIDITSVKVTNLPVQLYAKITQDTLEDNADNPNFENETFNSFAKTFSNDLQNLALNGIDDTYADEKFNQLNEGFINLINKSKEGRKYQKPSPSPTKIYDDIINTIKTANKEVINQSTIIMSKDLYIGLQEEIGKTNIGLPYLLNGGVNNILGIPIMTASYMPKNFVMITPLKNLIMSMGLNVRQTRWYDIEESSLKYKFELYCDFAVAKYDWIAYVNHGYFATA